MVEKHLFENVLKNLRKYLDNDVINYVCFIWFLIMCLLPMEFSKLKIGLLGILCLNSFLTMIFDKKRINIRFLIFAALFSFIYFLFLLNGVRNGYEFDSKLVEIFCFRPIVLFFLVNLISDKEKFLFFMKSIIISTLVIIIYNVICMLGNLHVIPKFFPWETGPAIVMNQFIALRVSNQGSLMYLLPMSIMLIGSVKKINLSLIFKIIVGINVVLGTLVVLLSGRRALQVCTLVGYASLFIYLILPLFKVKKINTAKVYKVIGAVCLFATVGFIVIEVISSRLGIHNLLSSAYSTFLDAIKQSTQAGSVRKTQQQALISEWLKKPVFGWGLNAYVRNLIRSQGTKWSYEYVYIAYLFQVGIVGVTILLVYTINILKKVLKKYIDNKDSELGTFFIASLVGMLCFIIGGYSNPLVTSLWAWIIILVCALVNLDEIN